MAPSAGHLHKLVVRNLKLLKFAWKKTSHLIQAKTAPFRAVQAELIPVRNARQPLHPIAYLRQSRSNRYSTLRQFSSAAKGHTSGVKYDRASFPKSRTGTAVYGQSGRAPFASTLRPNITGGTLGRTAGGYTLGSGRVGGARFFSHGPAAPAEIVQNVSQAVRAFWLSGQKVQYDGTNPRTGEKRYSAISTLQDETARKLRDLPKATPGSYIDFRVNPTITAFTPLSVVAGFSKNAENQSCFCENTLNTEGLLDVLSVDFSRALKDLAAILYDLRQLASLGDLPITYRSSTLRVHFPGCDAETVEKLCLEMGVRRGVVEQDEDFDAFVGTEIALLFPFAPSAAASEISSAAQYYSHPREKLNWQDMMSPSYTVQDMFSTQSESGFEDAEVAMENPWLSSERSPSGYDSLHSPSEEASHHNDPLEYQDFDGIYRFIQMCDDARR